MINQVPQVTDETIEICEGDNIALSANLINMTYLWNTGETTEEITATTAGEYSVLITNSDGCSNTKKISVLPVTIPVIKGIGSNGPDIIIDLETIGNFQFALDNGPFQASPIFESVEGGRYILNIAYGNNCGVVSQEFIHLVIPKFFTPNADGNNDLFLPEGLEFFNSYELSIFNRFGQLLKTTNQNNPSWDGTFNSAQMPSGNYWYRLQADDILRNGYFVLKR
jgi:gliding motility-associated-like protein